MEICAYCGRTAGSETHPPEHIFPAAVGGTLVTDAVCSSCNQRAGSEVDQPWMEWPLVMELRHRFDVRDRDRKRPRPVRWKGNLISADHPARVDLRGERVDVGVLPRQDEESGLRVYSGDPADVAKWRQRTQAADPRARFVEFPSEALEGPLQARVTWQLSVDIWPRFAAKVALGAASLIASPSWLESDEAGRLREVLWQGHASTRNVGLALAEGWAWAMAPLDATGVPHPIRAPEHFVALQRWQGRACVVLVAFGTFVYRVPVDCEMPGSDDPIGFVIDPQRRSHVAYTQAALDTEFRRRLA
jgi:hypothetical protein